MSTAKELLFEEEVRNKLKEGIDQLAEVVGVTLGPKGRNVGLQANFGAPTITSEGSHIIKDVELKDQYANMGVALGKEVASKIKESSGDGVTRGILLLQALVSHGVKNIASGASPIHIKRGIDKAVGCVLKEIDRLATKVEKESDIASIAKASASGDAEVSALIAEAFQKVGKEGVISLEDGKGTASSIQIVKGMELDRGYLSSYFCTNQENMSATLQNAKILITDKKISSVHEILGVLQTVATTAQELLIIADDIEADVLSTLVVNKLRGSLKVAAIKAPGFGDRRKAILEDIAILTQATVVSEEKGMQLKDATASVLGSAQQILITKDKTTLVDGAGSKERLTQRIKEIERETAATTSSYDKEKLEERKAKLSGGVAVISIGAMTEPAMKKKKQLFEDSLNATKAALAEGIVPGGCIVFFKAARVLKTLTLAHPEEQLGVDIVAKALEAPFKYLVKNSGFEHALLFNDIKDSALPIGFNVVSGKVEDLLLAGIIDPAKVVKNCLTYAASLAGVALLSEVLIGHAPEEPEEN